jgi:membrane protein YqaA with SNARE-associated domain
LFESLFQWFLSPAGLVALAALDASMLFFLPMGVEAAVVILTVRNRAMFWVFPLLAAAGSLLGAAVTYWIGHKIGEKGLENWVSVRKLDAIRSRIKDRGAMALALPALLPPPFPLTPLILACGALSVKRARFLVTLGAMRIVRFTIVAILGLVWGRQVLAVLESDTFKFVVGFFIVIALVGTAFTIYRLIVRTRTRGGQHPAA